MFIKRISKNKKVEIKISSNSDNESLDSISLDNESFISFKTKTNSIKSLSYSVSRLSLASIKRKREQIVISVKDKLKKVSPSFKNDFKNFIDKQKEKKLEDNFLGYYECLIPNNKELSIPKIYLSTARIDLHEEKSENPEKAKRLVLTKIKESPFNPFINNKIISLFIITGKSKLNLNGTGWTGIKYNEFPEWMQDDTVKHLINGTPVKGLGTYKVLIKKKGNTDIYKDIKLKELEENAISEDGFIHKMTLVGYYMLGIKENDTNSTNVTPEAEKWYKEAEKWCQEAEKLGSIEAKLCLGYMYSIGYNKAFYNPQKAKKLFKEVINAVEKTETITMKEMIIGKITTKESTTDKNVTEEATTDKKVTNKDKEETDDSAADKEKPAIKEEVIIVNEVIENASKELARIAMRNMAIIYHSSYVIKPFEWKNFIKIPKPNDSTIKKLSKKKLSIAIKWYEKSCELGDSQSAYHLGLLYESDHEIKDENEAEKWFKKAVQFDNNNLYAKAKLGRILINKEDVDENEKMKGIQMLKYAAENGLVMGQIFLGEAYERGQIGKKEEKENIKEAIKFYFKAAKQNNGYYSHVAQFRLRNFRASEIIPAGEEDIENIITLYVNELNYYYDGNEETLKSIILKNTPYRNT
jgi:TPR repeat protein